MELCIKLVIEKQVYTMMHSKKNIERDIHVCNTCLLQISMCSAPLRELSNPGASGSIFYLTEDDEFIIKTVQHKEGEFLQKLLPGYYMVSLVCGVYLWCEVKFYFYAYMCVVGYDTGPVVNQILMFPGNVVP